MLILDPAGIKELSRVLMQGRAGVKEGAVYGAETNSCCSLLLPCMSTAPVSRHSPSLANSLCFKAGYCFSYCDLLSTVACSSGSFVNCCQHLLGFRSPHCSQNVQRENSLLKGLAFLGFWLLGDLRGLGSQHASFTM